MLKITFGDGTLHVRAMDGGHDFQNSPNRLCYFGVLSLSLDTMFAWRCHSTLASLGVHTESLKIVFRRKAGKKLNKEGQQIGSFPEVATRFEGAPFSTYNLKEQ